MACKLREWCFLHFFGKSLDIGFPKPLPKRWSGGRPNWSGLCSMIFYTNSSFTWSGTDFENKASGTNSSLKYQLCFFQTFQCNIGYHRVSFSILQEWVQQKQIIPWSSCGKWWCKPPRNVAQHSKINKLPHKLTLFSFKNRWFWGSLSIVSPNNVNFSV